MTRPAIIDFVEALGDRANGQPEHVPEVLPHLLTLLSEHDDPAVLAAIVDAIGLTSDPSANVHLLPFASHPDSRVRLAVAQALPFGTNSLAAEALVLPALIALSEDDVDEVRDWATFSLAVQLSIDAPATRSALMARTTDRVQDVRDAALLGLSRRHDARAPVLVNARLDDEHAGWMVFEAALHLGDASLLSVLQKWCDGDPSDEALRAARDACDPERRNERTARHTALLHSIYKQLAREQSALTPALYCERGTVDVLVMESDPSTCWDADVLIERANNDIALAAQRLVRDLVLHS